LQCRNKKVWGVEGFGSPQSDWPGRGAPVN
jgi:hypothetical protein